MNKIKINIFSPGRFHVCDLARELDKNGFDVKFYSFVPAKRAEKFGLPRRCSSSLLIPMAPFLAMERVFFKRSGWAKRLSIKVQDWISSMVMRKCDICIAMSGNYILTPKKAKKQGALVIIERGSKHIVEQKAILDTNPNNKNISVPGFNYYRELESYQIADYIAIASQHVARSFFKHNYPKDKLFINPYGVDLSMFKPLSKVEKKYDVIMVGGWSFRKGCDLIVEALKYSELNFLHVGGIVDLEFPSFPNFTHVDSVDQRQLVDYYNMAKIALLPSREEGLAMVQAQAIACNLPLVGSIDSGAEDLKEMVECPECITIIDKYTPECVKNAIESGLKKYDQLGDKLYAGSAIENLTWTAYGKRYSEFLNIVSAKR
jgi:glycosyltransferase involved in cell wall biosynthesis